MNLRKTLLAALISLSFSGFAQAGPLTDLMKEIGLQFKDLFTTTQTAVTVDAAMAVKAHELGLKIEAAAAIMPDSIQTLPVADQPAAQVRYKDLMHQLAQKNVELEQAYIAGDKALALTILGQMNDLRKVGHTEFKP